MNLFKFTLLLCLSTTGLGSEEDIKRDATSSTSVDFSSLLSEAAALTSIFPAASVTTTLAFTTPGGNLLQPPVSLIAAIITAVPATILAELAQPSARSSIASEFAAGNTPSWYQDLPTAVKSYIEAINSQVRGGSVDLSATGAAFSFPASTTTTGVGKGDSKATSTSKGIAAQATGSVGLSLAAAVGILGVVIAL